MTRWIQTFALFSTLAFCGAGMAHAQLRGNGSGEGHLQSAWAKSASTQQVNNRQNRAELGVPRGDLRRDVAEASSQRPPAAGNH